MDNKDALFLYEPAAVPDDLKVVRGVADSFQTLPEAATTWVQCAHSLEQAAPLIEEFKAQTCGSSCSLAIINLNLMDDASELSFLLQPEMLGDPCAIFLATLRYRIGDAYALAREKVQREAQPHEKRSSSCFDCYSASTRNEVFSRVSHLAAAYLREAGAFACSCRAGLTNPATKELEQVRKSRAVYAGSAMNPANRRLVKGDVTGPVEI